MVKFGKEYRKYQINQWKKSYIDYKLLKQEIKKIKENIDELEPESRETELIENNDIGHPSIKVMELVPKDSINKEVQNLESLYNLRYGNELKRFIDLLEKEFRKCYINFVNQEKELYMKVNRHCYAAGLYKDYTILNVFNEIKEISSTLKFSKQLNCFINDNVMALKKILKKFDKKFQRYFGIIEHKFILTHLSSKNSDLEYLLQFKLIDESTTICENNLYILFNLYKRLRGNNINVNNNNPNEKKRINDNNKDENNKNNLNNLDNEISELKNRINICLDNIDELTYFKIQYREWFYYAKQNNRLVKNNQHFFENDIYNPVLSSTYIKDSLLEKCISSKNAFKEIERSQSPLSHSNKTNLILIYIQAVIYGTMITNIFPVISKYFESYIKTDFKAFFLIPLISTYIAQIFPYIIFVNIHNLDYKNYYMKISYIISYCFIFLSSLFLIFVRTDNSNKTKNFIFILLSRVFIGLANNQVMNTKYITLYLTKYKLPHISKTYLIAELIGLIFGPFITFILSYIDKFNITETIQYNYFNCVGWYGIIISFIVGLIHTIVFIRPLSYNFVMVKDERNISGKNYYQRSESEISRKKYLREQNTIYRKTYNTVKKKNQRFSENNEINKNDIKKLIIKNENNDEIDEKDENNKIEINNDLEEKLIVNNDIENIEDKNRLSVESNNKSNNSLDVSTGGNIALTTKQKNMINEIEKVLDKRNEECNFNDMNKIPKSIDSIIKKEKISFGYINQNLLLLSIIFFFCSLIKSNLILNYIYYLQEKLNSDNNNNIKQFCLLIFLLGIFQIFKFFFIVPFYQVNYKFKIFMLFSATSLVLFNLPLIIKSIYEKKYIFIILNIILILGCNIIYISCSCYISFILSQDWKIFGKNVGKWPYYIILCGKISGGLICIFQSPNGYINHCILFGISLAFLIFVLILIFFTRILRIKGITRVIRKIVFEIDLDK